MSSIRTLGYFNDGPEDFVLSFSSSMCRFNAYRSFFKHLITEKNILLSSVSLVLTYQICLKGGVVNEVHTSTKTRISIQHQQINFTQKHESFTKVVPMYDDNLSGRIASPSPISYLPSNTETS